MLIRQMTDKKVTEVDIEESWKSVLPELGLSDAVLISESSLYPYRRVYEKLGLVYKVVQSDKDIIGRRQNTLYDEYKILQRCEGIVDVPAVEEFFCTDSVDVLVSKKIDGVPLSTEATGPFRFIYLMYQVARVMIRLAFRRISHNDLTLDNILVREDSTVSVIDFDQATRARAGVAILRTVFGVDVGDGIIYSSIRSLIEDYSKSRPHVSLRIISYVIWPISYLVRKIFYFFLRVARQIRSREYHSKAITLPVLRTDASEGVKKLRTAWEIAQGSDASSPGETLAYYSLLYEGYQFPGERPWGARWELLGSVTGFEGKRVLELGCNMGLLSCYLMREKQAAASMAIDADAAILDAANRVSDALDVQVQFRQVNFDQTDKWEKEINDFKPDVVFALNVLNWVGDKDRFLKFLGGFGEVVFEGHDTFEVEKQRLRSVGFRTIIPKGVTERDRDVLLCRQ